MIANRKTVRRAVASNLSTALTTAQVVYNHMKGDFSGQSPVVRVMSVGSERKRFTAEGDRARFVLNIQLWVLYSDKHSGWTEEEAEDALDDLEHEVATWVVANRTTDEWKDLEFLSVSNIQTAMFSGNPYLIEDIQISLKAF